MDPQRWQRLQDLFDQAVDLPSDQRLDYLNDACADPGLVQQVHSLILSSDAEEDHGEKAIAEALGSALGDKALVNPENRTDGAGGSRALRIAAGDRVGNYRILGEIGSGGMGTVFRASRDDGEYQQEVAIKVVSDRRMTSDEIVRRFKTEREILATLDHPYIARLLDGGTTESGIPYVVMEAIDGDPITTYCDRKKLSTSERLQLFTRVCEAVQAAHRNLVIHRDLKPSNILVTSDGTPKLLDFGIAKLIAPEAMTFTVAETSADMRLMTPDYASPEQILGEPVTTSTDVYSLGVLLYQLLAGVLPFPVAESQGQLYQRAIDGKEPAPPSTSLTRNLDDTDPQTTAEARGIDPPALKRLLSGDLDHITLMALRGDPQQRYAAVDLLRQDIQNHLEGLPVLARPATVRYQLSKFVVRHKEAVAIASVLILALIGSTVFYTQRMATERRIAEREAETARQVSDFMRSMFEVSDPTTSDGAEITARQLLDEGALRLNDELRDQPLVKAEMLNVIGDVYRALGLYETSEEQLLVALDTAREELGNVDHSLIANILNDLGLVHVEVNEMDEGERLVREALKMRRRLFGEKHVDVAYSLDNLGGIESDRGNYEESERYRQQALQLFRELREPDDYKIAYTINNLGTTVSNQGRYEEAIALYDEVLAHFDKYGGSRREIARALSNRSVTLKLADRTEEAIASQERAFQMRIEAMGEEHEDTTASMQSLGSLMRDVGRYEEAGELLSRAIEIRRRRMGPDHNLLGAPLTNYATLLRDHEQYEESLEVFDEAIRVHRVAMGERHPNTAHPLVGKAIVLARMGNEEAAAPYFEEALSIRMEALGDEHPYTLDTLSMLGRNQFRRGQEDRGLEKMELAVETLETTLGSDSRYYKLANDRLGEARASNNQLEGSAATTP